MRKLPFLKNVQKEDSLPIKKSESFADDATVQEHPDNAKGSFGSDYHTVTCTGEHAPYVSFPFRLIGNVRSLYFPVPEFVEGGVKGGKDTRTVLYPPDMAAVLVKDEDPETPVLPAESGPGGMDRAKRPAVAKPEERAGHRMQSGNIL